MKAVILAAGKGTRMRPLTEDTPKPLLPVAGKPIVEHTVNLVENYVDEIVIVAGYRKQQIEDYFSGMENVSIVEQEKPLGTADAALEARSRADGKTLIVNGDDIYSVDMEEIRRVDTGIVTAEVENTRDFGVLEIDDGKLVGIREKSRAQASGPVNTGFYVVKDDFFDLLEEVEESDRGEYEITDALLDYSKNRDLKLIQADDWYPCGCPWQLVDANERLMKNIDGGIEGEIHESAVIKDSSGPVVVEKGAVIRENTVVEGPAVIKSGASVGPNAYIRPGTVLHEGVEVGNGSEIKNSVICETSSVPHLNYIGDSYVGSDANIGGGTIVSNLRHDNEDVMMEVKGELRNTGRQKMGAIIGSKARVGVNCSINPGRKIGYKGRTRPGQEIKRNVPSGEVDEV